MDLKIKDVAELINVSETTIRRWLATGRIPAYRLNGQYRFSRAEIEDWVLQQKLSAEQSSVSAEEKNEGNMQFSLYRALYRGTTLVPARELSKEAMIRAGMQYMHEKFDLDADVLTELFMDRERLMSTSLNHGIAVPHTRDFLLNTHFDVVLTVYPEQPLDWGALDGEPVHTLFFLFASEDKNHLHLLSKVAHLSSGEKTRAFLRTKPSKERLLDYVKHWESSLNG